MKKKKSSHAANIFIKECLALALVSLLQKKELSAISITELTRAAGVSRMAYYRNFTSKEEILYSYFNIILQRYDEAEKADYLRDSYYDVNRMIHYFSFLLSYKTFLLTVIAQSYGYIFSETMTNYIVNKWLTDKSDQMQRYKLYAFSGALYNLYIGWSKNNFRETPEEMAQIFYSQQPACSHVHKSFINP